MYVQASYILIVQEYNNFIINHTTPNALSTGAYWVGGADRAEEGVWRWVSSNTPISSAVQDWIPGEPNNSGGDEDCLAINYAGPHWNDRPCHIISRYICEVMSG